MATRPVSVEKCPRCVSNGNAGIRFVWPCKLGSRQPLSFCTYEDYADLWPRWREYLP